MIGGKWELASLYTCTTGHGVQYLWNEEMWSVMMRAIAHDCIYTQIHMARTCYALSRHEHATN